MRSAIALALLALASPLAAAPAANDVCADCHDAPPVPAEHPPVATTSTQTCGECHASEAGDPYIEAVHGEHLELGLGCDFCHGDAVPSAEELEALISP